MTMFAGTEDSFEYTDREATWVRWNLDLILLTMVLFHKHSTLSLLIYYIVNTYVHIPIH
jgi:hypothetical protein